ncbi:MAG TPA: hypothetical protein VFY57_08715 [Rubrobacteraceae bacterium]|nr:hypothetical protein [Rubrobacteraceae bacterium]
MSGVGPQENLDVALGAAMAVLPGVGLLSLAGLYGLPVGVALIVLALRLRGCEGGGLQGDLNPRGGHE